MSMTDEWTNELITVFQKYYYGFWRFSSSSQAKSQQLFLVKREWIQPLNDQVCCSGENRWTGMAESGSVQTEL